MQPLISVIIPVYNHAHTLKKTIECVFNQTYRPLEVIIVNDGSTDNFNEAVKECLLLTEGDCIGAGSVLSVISQENAGAPAARNRGFAASKGEYVIFWDADTIAKPQMLQKMYDALQKNSEAAYAYSQFKFGWKKMKSQNFDEEKLKKINYIDTTSLVRRGALLTHPEAWRMASPPFQGGAGVVAAEGPWDETLKRFQDWDLWLTLLERGKTGVFIPEVLYKKIVSKSRLGISNWLPSFMFNFLWKSDQVNKYEAARAIIWKKHGLS